MRSRVILLGLLALLAAPASAGEVEIFVSGCEPGGGLIRVAAFASEADFDASRREAGVEVPASASRVRAVIPDLTPGSYGFAVFQDVDGNEKVSTNFLGIPNEPHGFSNDARNRFGPPDFEKMRVTVTDAPLTLEITID
jgi:uncharacterized protein (DUF2141 family)